MRAAEKARREKAFADLRKCRKKEVSHREHDTRPSPTISLRRHAPPMAAACRARVARLLLPFQEATAIIYFYTMMIRFPARFFYEPGIRFTYAYRHLARRHRAI